MGSIIGLTAFMYYILDRFSTQPMYATITELIYSLPVLFVFLVGVLADNMDRKNSRILRMDLRNIIYALALFFY